MQRLSEAVLRIQTASRTPIDTYLARPVDADAKFVEFDRKIQAMRNKRSIGEGAHPPKLDIDAVLRRWERARPDVDSFSRRELLALSWDLRGASDKVLIEALHQAGLVPERPRFLRGLWHSHQQHWRLGTSKRIEELVSDATKSTATLPRWLRAIASDARLASPKAPEILAQRTRVDWRGGTAPLEEVGVLPSGELGRLVLDKARRLWLDEVAADRADTRVGDLLADGLAGLRRKDATPADLFQRAVEELFEDVQRSPQPYKQAITQLILSDDRLGHPLRSATRGNWVGISDRARKAAVQLFAARDLQAFFEVLIGKANDYQERRSFWERYVESPQLTDFAIASDRNDLGRLRTKLGNVAAGTARLYGSPDNHSAFMIKFTSKSHDIVIVEISQANNAMYLFDADTFEQRVGSLEQTRFDFHALKDQNNNLERLAHTSLTWHERFARTLRSYGVHPGVR